MGSVTVYQFDNVVEPVVEDVPIESMAKFGESDFEPRGMTALLDGIGSMIAKMERTVPAGTLAPEQAPVIVILTDGNENASQEFTRAAIFERITAKRELGWKFTFMGANQDAISVGTSIGLRAETCMTYAARGPQQTAAWSSAAAFVSRT